jgi:colicin import membrane protein
MDEDACRLLELLRPAVERAEQIGQQQQALLERHQESAKAFADQFDKIKEAAETERARLLAERADVAALRESAVAQAREETDAIFAAARAEEEAALARIAELLHAQAQREAAHAAKMAAAEAAHAAKMAAAEAKMAAADDEREELIRQREAEHLERLRLREAEHGARIDRLFSRG